MLLDVGPLMGDLLEPAAKAVSAFIQGKVCPMPAAAAGQWNDCDSAGQTCAQSVCCSWPSSCPTLSVAA